MIAFGNNDRPGVMLAGAARTYINRFGTSPGRQLAIFTNNDDGWRTAIDAQAAGIEIAALVDSRAEPPLPRRVRHQGADRHAGLARAWRARRQRHRCHGCAGSETADRVRCARRLGRLESRGASDLPPRRQAGMERHRSRPSRPVRYRPGMNVAGAADRLVHARTMPRRTASRRARSRRSSAAIRLRRLPVPRADDDPTAIDAAVARQGKPREGVRRFPERRDDERHRARGPRRLQRGRASQALHHARHGDRPRQDRRT